MSPKDNDAWTRAFERALRTTVRFQSPHVPLEARPGLPLPRPTSRPTPKKTVARDSTLLELFQELVRSGVPRDEAAEWLLNSLLGHNFIVTSGQRIGDIRVDEASELVVLGLDGKPLDPAAIIIREPTVKDPRPIHPHKIAARRAKIAEKAREKELEERLKASSAAPSPPPASAADAQITQPPKPPMPERDPVWEELVKPQTKQYVADHGPFDNRTRLVEWVINDLKVERSKATIIRWVTPYDGEWFTLNGPRRKRNVASGPGASLRS